MSMSLNDVLSELRTKTVPYVVQISMTIHGQHEHIFAQAPYTHYICVGYGRLRYLPDAEFPDEESKLHSEFSNERLSTHRYNLDNTNKNNFTCEGLKQC